MYIHNLFAAFDNVMIRYVNDLPNADNLGTHLTVSESNLLSMPMNKFP